ncbi:hypothetical protein PENSPDRAFT_165169 [Peniophora sp. CONT]|nr:hypothetical protein PENSPDRAFT_165169 [Peniophora sp. CONT]
MPVPAGSTISSGPDKLLARHIAEANMFLCMVHLRTFQDTFAWPDLAAAFRHGEAGMRLGLLTSASRMTGSKIRKFAFAQMHIAMRMPGPPPDTGLPPITNAEDKAYVDEIFSCETIVLGYANNYYDEDAEESDDEEVLACGRPGCNVTTTAPNDFKRCGGKCPMHIKPYYCSKDCQKQVCVLFLRITSPVHEHLRFAQQDWKRHKAECQRPSDSEEKQVKFTTLQGEKAEVDLSSLKNSKAEIARRITQSYSFIREDKRVPETFATFFAEMEAAVSGNKNGQTPEEFMRMVEKWPKGWVLPHH